MTAWSERMSTLAMMGNRYSVSYYELPLHLEKTFRIRGYCTVELDNLFVGLSLLHGAGISYVRIRDTPHYIFARHVIHGEPAKANHGYSNYAHYASINDGVCAEQEFTKLIWSISDDPYDHKKSPILVFRTWRRVLPLNRWDVADGFHRLAALAALGQEELTVATLRQRKTLVERLVGKLMREHDLQQ